MDSRSTILMGFTKGPVHLSERYAGAIKFECVLQMKDDPDLDEIEYWGKTWYRFYSETTKWGTVWVYYGDSLRPRLEERNRLDLATWLR